jgi:hypothetical protein
MHGLGVSVAAGAGGQTMKKNLVLTGVMMGAMLSTQVLAGEAACITQEAAS